MSEAQEAIFNLSSYKFNSFSYQDPIDEVEGVILNFAPVGSYHEESRRFILGLDFKALYERDNEEQQVEIMSISITAHFVFKADTKFEDIPEYFYVNAIAIVFPYIRAFVSTLTQLANTKPMTLPIMRLDNLGSDLKDLTIKL